MEALARSNRDRIGSWTAMRWTAVGATAAGVAGAAGAAAAFLAALRAFRRAVDNWACRNNSKSKHDTGTGVGAATVVTGAWNVGT